MPQSSQKRAGGGGIRIYQPGTPHPWQREQQTCRSDLSLRLKRDHRPSRRTA